MGVFKFCAVAVLTASIAASCYPAPAEGLAQMQGRNLEGSSNEENLVIPDNVCEHGGLWNRYEVPFGGSVTVVVADTKFTLTHPIEDDAAYLEVTIRDLEPYTRILPYPDTKKVQTYHYGDTPQAQILVRIVNRNPPLQPPYLPRPDDVGYYRSELDTSSDYIIYLLEPKFEENYKCVPPVPDGMPGL